MLMLSAPTALVDILALATLDILAMALIVSTLMSALVPTNVRPTPLVATISEATLAAATSDTLEMATLVLTSTSVLKTLATSTALAPTLLDRSPAPVTQATPVTDSPAPTSTSVNRPMLVATTPTALMNQAHTAALAKSDLKVTPMPVALTSTNAPLPHVTPTAHVLTHLVPLSARATLDTVVMASAVMISMSALTQLTSQIIPLAPTLTAASLSPVTPDMPKPTTVCALILMNAMSKVFAPPIQTVSTPPDPSDATATAVLSKKTTEHAVTLTNVSKARTTVMPTLLAPTVSDHLTALATVAGLVTALAAWTSTSANLCSAVPWEAFKPATPTAHALTSLVTTHAHAIQVIPAMVSTALTSTSAKTLTLAQMLLTAPA